MASSLPGGPELACCLASPPPVHAGVLSVILGQADRTGFQYSKDQPQETFRSDEARPRECQGKWGCYGLKKSCVMSPRLQRSVTWSTLYQNGSVTSEDIKISHEPFAVHLGQSSYPPLTARPPLMYVGKTALSDTDYTSHTSQIEKSGLISTVRRTVASFV